MDSFVERRLAVTHSCIRTYYLETLSSNRSYTFVFRTQLVKKERTIAVRLATIANQTPPNALKRKTATYMQSSPAQPNPAQPNPNPLTSS
jgi:hypothetical protein